MCFTNGRRGVHECLSTVSIFLFPSIFRNIPFTLVRTRTGKLTYMVSRTISRRTIIFPREIEQLSLSESGVR